ncbi:DUF3906 family protein [Polycladomyces subterraneus]|uniref:DUF3906 family protein n=1 Tax=Polycladomyces subterraneus TaxID=1016997 RepID=A0ABT8ILU2_9BACL|nr:DUF3906 family protein [Polycladomyces subterraneus]MDN4593748.1 DUF3906 family protein [Polycladomyces subterraneus]
MSVRKTKQRNDSLDPSLFLYRLSVVTEDGETHTIVVLAEDDETAFSAAEKEWERNFLVPPKVAEWALEEKRRVKSGSGYVVSGIEPENSSDV